MSTMTLKGAKGEGDFFRLRFWGAVLLVLGALLALTAFPTHAQTAPLAGTSIGNQASASYTDANAVLRITVSNTVSTLVAQVSSFTLTQSQTKVGAPGQTIAYPHTLTNTGNGPATFSLAVANITNNSYAVAPSSTTTFFADNNCDGVADNSVALNTTTTPFGPVAPGALACFVAQVSLAASGAASSFDVQATSNAVTASNTDSVTITTNAAINVTKSISTTTGPSGTVVVYQLTYRNTGTVSAGNVVITDTLPSGASFVPNSGRWGAATGTTLTELNSTDVDAGVANVSPYRLDFSTVGATVVAILERVDPGVQGIIEFQVRLTSATAPATINNQAQWCYNDIGLSGTIVPTVVSAACATVASTGQWILGGTPAAADLTNPGGISSSTNTNQSNIVPFVIPLIGSPGAVVFNDANRAKAISAANPSGDATNNLDGTNPLVNVTQAIALAPGDRNLAITNANVGQGTIATWDVTVWNTGSGTDTFNVYPPTAGASVSNFPAGTTFLLFRNDGATPLTDSNNDGVVDTGPVQPNAGNASGYTVHVVAVLPPSGLANTYHAVLTAQSTNTISVTNTVAVRAIVVSSRVNLTNYNGGGAPATPLGFGEVAPVTTVTANPGTAATFGLIINNTGAVSDSYDLSYNLTTGTYNTATLAFTAPLQFDSGFSLAFYRDNGATCASADRGAQISNSGVISAGGSVRACAVVTVPANAPAGNTDIYFRAISPTTFSGDALLSSGDVKFDRLTVNVFRSVAITPNNSGQVFPGGSIQYCHTVTNGGNVSETIAVTQSDQSLFATGVVGWAQFATVYRDTNNNCVLDGTENTAPQTLTPAGLQGAYAAGERRNFIVVVQAPSGASAGQTNNNTFTLTTTATPTVLTAVATDITTVVVGQVQLVKEQVLDPSTTCATNMNLAGVGALTFAQTQIISGATPGRCIVYRVTATNVGTQSVLNLNINDVAPPNTLLSTTGTPSVPFCTTTAPVGTCTATVSGQNIVAALTAPLTSPLTGGSNLVLYFRVRINP